MNVIIHKQTHTHKIKINYSPPIGRDKQKINTVYQVYLNALIISEEAMHYENKNCEILKYADKKICGIVEYEHVG